MVGHKIKGTVYAPNANLVGGTVADLTEDSAAIGGTNDGDLPDISTVSASPSQAEVTAIRDAVRENAAKVNELMAALRAAGVIT